MEIQDEIDFNPVFFHSVFLPEGAFMKNFLPLVLLLSATFAFAEEIKINYDEALVPEYTLPDPLTCNDGTKVTTVEQWEKVRRPEILEQFQREMFGRLPTALREAGNHPDFVTFRVFEQSDGMEYCQAGVASCNWLC